AIIMDGNGRWAQRRMRNRFLGHRRGAASVREAVTTCRDLGIPFLTLYAFSQENWSRPKREVELLMRLFEEYLVEELPEMIERDIRMRAAGRLDELPPSVLRKVRETEEKTRGNRTLTVTLCVSYGGRQEICDAATALIEAARRGEFEGPVTEERLRSELYQRDVPDPDLMIRTGGDHRISNFLLWQIAYAELYFTPTLWPDFGRDEFVRALIDYQSRQRRFGLTGDQIAAAAEPVGSEPRSLAGVAEAAAEDAGEMTAEDAR
ncbi:MAG: di-trans,poly-cis-decaprenylcistransferase, partial [Myxococcales bacterium]|nr:di-trans,poly-cis-decaprenylcistransferase [Myxococcales bacterium]